MTLDILDSRKLKYFATVVECGSFAKAAAALHITQPALSIAIKKLEEELKTPLLDRSIKPIGPTIFGEAVFRSATTIGIESARLHRELHDVADLNNGSVSIVIGATFPYQLVLETHRRIRETYPNFALVVEMGGYTVNLDAMLNGEHDLIFSQLPLNRSDLRVNHKEIMRDRFEVVCSSQHPLAKLKAPDVADLVKYPWVSGGPLDDFLPGWSALFQKHGLTAPRASVNTLTLAITHSLLQSHDCLTMLPVKSIQAEIDAGLLTSLDIPELHWDQIKGVSWAKNRSMPPSVDYFLRCFFHEQTFLDSRD
ncbi:LysR family transcriptional regulator [uncultured Parasphingorhabdus sp.]|uniref:LysR family transcriptional regulator n=1 Tax=uncultured Parasphingorhabdus sp. TaxID=2709694 RepID=UPI002AA83AF6|nr:LysR family transcriptional regulator [uncultured Parasphingorhabdus sp.]